MILNFRSLAMLSLCCALGCHIVTHVEAKADDLPDQLPQLDQHFDEPMIDDFGPWIFTPKELLDRVTTLEHPGLASIHVAEVGQDIKGLLRAPIPIDVYPLPWQFQCSFMQNFDAMTGRTPTQVNYAVGVNLAVTFSDPTTWPEDRLQRPPDTHDVQLLVVHLGNYGETGVGLPQLRTDSHPSPETYLVWGRGDIAGPAAGDWQIPHIYIGDGARYGGPASNQLYFRASVISPTHVTVGIKFDASHGWNIRHIDLSHLGSITGIWEIGPIMSNDHWIPDVLAPELGIQPPPEVLPPDPKFEYYLDYCVFYGAKPIPFEQHSDEFDIAGYLGKWQIQEQSTIVENFSRPGWMAVHLLGPSAGTCFAAAGVSNLNLEDYPPPWEIEFCATPPSNDYPWSVFINFGIYSGRYEDPHWLRLIGEKVPESQPGELLGYWQPGLLNSRDGGLQPYPTTAKPGLKFEWDEPLPPSIIGAKPVYMLIQVIDTERVRIGYKARADDDWHLSKVCNVREQLGEAMGQLGPHHAFSLLTGPSWGGEYGLPAYQTFFFDYIRYRYGLSTD